MAGLSHIALNIALCSNVAKAAPAAVEPVRVRMEYRKGDPEYDKTYTFAAADGPQAFVEFDIRQGLYRLEVEAPKLGCSATRYVNVLPDRNRKIDVTMVAGPPDPGRAQMLMDGTAPTSFLYTKPTYVLLDKSVACNQPVGTPLPAAIDYEYDQGAYYLWLYGDPAIVGTDPVLALKIRTPTGLAHYVHVPIPYSYVTAGWPGSVRFDVNEDMIDSFVTEKTGVLLCLKLFETSVH